MAGQLVQSAPFFPGPTTKRPRSRLRRLIVALLIAGGGLALGQRPVLRPVATRK